MTHAPRPLYTVPLPGYGMLRLGDRCLLMGILNVTPDSFADAGLHLDPDDAVASALEPAKAKEAAEREAVAPA